MSKLRNCVSVIKILTLILLGFNLSACYDSMYLDEQSHPMTNRKYSFYEFYDSPYSYANSPYYDSYYFERPITRGHYHNQRVRRVNNQYHHHYYEADNHHQRHQGYQAGMQEGRRAERDQARQAQIQSDRALAQRLQNEEIAQANRQAQIASDRALAERLQAEEDAIARERNRAHFRANQ